jgi:hypothetical protein
MVSLSKLIYSNQQDNVEKTAITEVEAISREDDNIAYAAAVMVEPSMQDDLPDITHTSMSEDSLGSFDSLVDSPDGDNESLQQVEQDDQDYESDEDNDNNNQSESRLKRYVKSAGRKVIKVEQLTLDGVSTVAHAALDGVSAVAHVAAKPVTAAAHVASKAATKAVNVASEGLSTASDYAYEGVYAAAGMAAVPVNAAAHAASEGLSTASDIASQGASAAAHAAAVPVSAAAHVAGKVAGKAAHLAGNAAVMAGEKAFDVYMNRNKNTTIFDKVYDNHDNKFQKVADALERIRVIAESRGATKPVTRMQTAKNATKDALRTTKETLVDGVSTVASYVSDTMSPVTDMAEKGIVAGENAAEKITDKTIQIQSNITGKLAGAAGRIATKAGDAMLKETIASSLGLQSESAGAEDEANQGVVGDVKSAIADTFDTTFDKATGMHAAVVGSIAGVTGSMVSKASGNAVKAGGMAAVNAGTTTVVNTSKKLLGMEVKEEQQGENPGPMAAVNSAVTCTLAAAGQTVAFAATTVAKPFVKPTVAAFGSLVKAEGKAAAGISKKAYKEGGMAALRATKEEIINLMPVSTASGDSSDNVSTIGAIKQAASSVTSSVRGAVSDLVHGTEESSA